MLQSNNDAGQPQRKYFVDGIRKAIGNINYIAQKTVIIFLNT
jgi:hypothetical protein